MYQYTKHAIDILNKLVAIRTVNPPGNEKEAAVYIREELNKLGFKFKMVKSSKNRESIVAFKGNPKGKKLILNGHMDTVAVSDMWKTNPFTTTIKGNRIYGRGCADMKGGISAVISAVKRVVDEGFDFNGGQLILAFVADEELNNTGTKLVLELEEVKTADYAIIAEPTSMDICIAHKGFVRFEITVFGKSVHSSNPSGGVNAIYKMNKVIKEIEKYNNDLKKISHPILPSPSAAVVTIEGGIKDNIIPDICKIKIDRRLLPTETLKQVEDEILNILSEIKAVDDEFGFELNNYLVLMPGEISSNSKIVKLSKKAYEKALGKKPKIEPFKATSEQTLFLEKGIETVIIGPGHIEQAHIDDEFIDIDQIETAIMFFHEAIKEILK